VAEGRHLRAVLGDEPQVTAELSATNWIACSTRPITSARPAWVARAVAEHFALTA
jgi:3-carboxy-cis,cis-muconate cycloisomerase